MLGIRYSLLYPTCYGSWMGVSFGYNPVGAGAHLGALSQILANPCLDRDINGRRLEGSGNRLLESGSFRLLEDE